MRKTLRWAVLVAALFGAATSYAQGTAPPTPTAVPAEGPAGQAEMSEMKSKLKSMYDEFRTVKERLPFTLGAGVYLFYYQPVDNSTFAPTDKNGSFQVYAFYLKLDKEVLTRHGAFGGHAELRMRDGGHVGANSSNNYLRGFFSSNIWFQEIYAYYRPWSFATLKAGKVYRKTGIFWDDSFFGNLQYFDGHKLNPDWGLSVEGDKELLGGKLGLEYSLQYFYNSDGINGSLDYGRTVGAPPDANAGNARIYSPSPEGQTDSAGNRIGELKHVIDARLALTVKPTRRVQLTVGASGLNARVLRSFKSGLLMTAVNDEAQFSHAIGEVTLKLQLSATANLRLIGEYTHQWGPGLRDADYLLTGARFTWKDLAVYCHLSYVRYDLGPAVQEYEVLPGVSYAIGGGLAALVEYNEWQRKDPRGVAFPLQAVSPGTTADWYAIDRSLNVVLVYSY